MRRFAWLWTWGVLAAMAADLAVPARADQAPPGAGPSPARPASAEGTSPQFIFLNAPTDLDQFWKKLGQPDFILMSGEEFQKRLEGSRQAPAPPGPWTVVIRSVAIRGDVRGDLANLSLQLEVSVLVSGPSWVAIRLDNQTVKEAYEGDRVLPLRVAPGGAWQVELQGGGEHQVRVELEVPVRSTDEGRHLEFAIPEAPSTLVQLDVDPRVVEARAGALEPVSRESIDEGKGIRLSTHLSPRSRLELTWRVEAEPGAQLPPLLSIQGEIAMDIDPGSLRTRSSWAIKSVRGSSRSLEFRLDPADEVLELTLDGQSIPAGIEGSTRLTIPLTEPLRPGSTRRLVMTTRRTLPVQATARLTFQGFPLANAKEQAGALGIAQGGSLWVGGTSGRGVRQIDPRTELPADLRARPATFLAYQFVDQPFELNLRIDPAPPLVRTEARTTVGLEARRARIETQLECAAANGRLFDLRIAMPPALGLESVGPKDVVDSWQVAREPDGSQLLTARLTSRTQEANGFTIQLVGRQSIDPSRPVPIALFQPRDSSLGGGRIAVLADRDLTVELADRRDGPEDFRRAHQDPPADWPGWAGHSGPAALWLRYDGNPPALPLKLAVHPRSVSRQTSLLVEVSRRGVEVRQETEVSVQFGVLDRLDVEVPRALEGRWEVEGEEVARRSDLAGGPDGVRIVRLDLVGEVSDRVSLRFRYQLPLEAGYGLGRAVEFAVPWLEVRAGKSAPVKVRVASDPSVRLESRARGWELSRGADGTSADEAGGQVRFSLLGLEDEEESTPPTLSARAEPLTTLPSAVASRLWLRTVQTPEGDLRTLARYWFESHESSFSLALPAGSDWVGARVGGEPVVPELLPGTSGYRLPVPPRWGKKPLLVELDYVVHARTAAAAEAWFPPRLLEGVVGQTFWEARVPGTRAVIGVPTGWTDENQWYWDAYVWKRRPWRTSAELATWVGVSPASSKAADEIEEEGRGDSHNYLFGRPGPPVGLPLRIASRAWLLAVCSGSVLGLGVLVLYRRPPFRLLGAASLALVLVLATAVQPSVTFLVLQSAMVGVPFTILAVLMQRWVERPRRPSATVFGDPATLTPGATVGSSVSRSVGAGSDDSTAIRVRPGSTVDHLAASSPSPSDATSVRGISRE